MEFRQSNIKRYLAHGRRYVYHRPTGAPLPDLPLDHPDMQAAITAAERAATTQSTANDAWGGQVPVGFNESLAPLQPPAAPDCIAFTVPQIIRFIWRAAPKAMLYYHHGNLLEDGRRDPMVRHKGRYIATCVQFGILHPRQRRGADSDTHYYASRSDQTLTGLPRNVLDGTVTPDEYQALVAITERQANMATTRAIRDSLGIADTDAADMRNAFIRRGWLTNGRPPELTDLGLSMLT